jgi:hypothetical protein
LENRLAAYKSIQKKFERQKQLINNALSETPPILIIDDANFVLQVNKQCLLQVGFKKLIPPKKDMPA